MDAARRLDFWLGMPCPSDGIVGDFVARRLGEDGAMDVAMHVHECDACRQRVAGTIKRALDDAMAPTSPAAEGAVDLPPGTIVDRYVIVAPLGSGGMGVVYAAKDPQLDRKVAIKLMKRGIAVNSGEPATRLLREAQAMARLAHANVLGVYQAGVHDGHVYLAMEHIDGGTLLAWLRDAPRGWREIVARFVAAGRGLAAAHDAGLVHRDFKPSNVMCSRDGRVLVTDFGLVRAAGEPNDRAMGSSESALDSQLTQAGAVLGTPRYMAPEQRAGNADARSDQYSYCVALGEALQGKHAPAPIRRAIARGLAADPYTRYPTMHELLADLERRPSRVPWIAGGAIAVAGIAAFALWPAPPQPACPAPVGKLAGVWDAPNKLAIQARFAASGAPAAADAWRGTEHALDVWVDDWVAMRIDACEATRVRGEQSQDALDLRIACLDQRWVEARELTDVLAHADAGVVHKSVEAARSLTPVAMCADVARLRTAMAEPRLRADVDRLRGELAKATALELAGKYKDALAIAQPIAAHAKQLGHRPLEADALLVLGRLENEVGDAKAAEPTLRAAALAGEAGHNDRAVADAAIQLVQVTGDTLGRADDGVAWADRAAAAIERLGGDDAREAKRLRGLGAVLARRGDTGEAKRTLTRALALTEKTHSADSVDIAYAHQALAIALFTDDPAAATAEVEKARAVLARVLGDKHPRVAMLLANLGVFAAQQGDLVRARASLERAIAIAEPALGANHPDVTWMHDTLGVVYLREGEAHRATAMFRRVVDNDEATGDPSIVLALVNLGTALDLDGDAAQAEALHQRALAMCAGKLTPDHPRTIAVATSYAELLARHHKDADALARYRTLLAIGDKLGPHLADVLSGIGHAELALHRPADAIAPLERSVRVRETHGGDVGDLGQARFALAQALWDTNRDRPRARELARSARAAFDQAGPRAKDGISRADAWLASH